MFQSAKRGRRAKKEEATFDVDQSVDGLPEDIATTSTKPARDVSLMLSGQQ